MKISQYLLGLGAHPDASSTLQLGHELFRMLDLCGVAGYCFFPNDDG